MSLSIAVCEKVYVVLFKALVLLLYWGILSCYFVARDRLSHDMTHIRLILNLLVHINSSL